LPVQEARDQIDRIHRRGAPHRGAFLGEKCECTAECDGDESGGQWGAADAAQRPEDRRSKNADTQAGYDEGVVGAGALEVGAQIAIDEGFFSDEHGV